MKITIYSLAIIIGTFFSLCGWHCIFIERKAMGICLLFLSFASVVSAGFWWIN